MDNRLGAFVALEAARLVSEEGGAPGDVAAVAVAQEEISFAGARTSAFALDPGVAIVVDVTFSTDPPGHNLKELGKHPTGSGPVIMRGSTLHPHVFELLYETAEAHDIPFTVDVSGRVTGTDADAIHLSKAGVPTGVVAIPLRYMHSPVELVELTDVRNAARLIAAFAQRLGPGTSFEPELDAAALRRRRHAPPQGGEGAQGGLQRRAEGRVRHRRPERSAWPRRARPTCRSRARCSCRPASTPA